MKRYTLLFAACFCFISSFAAYLRDVPVTLTQPDGTVLQCFASGDEYFNYLHDKEGYTIMQHPVTGYYVYADKRDGKLVATGFVAGRVDPASKNLLPYNLISPEEWMQRRKAWEVEDPRPKNRDGQPNHGTLNNIAIFIRFADDEQFTNAFSSIDNMFNDMTGSYSTSMRSYFQAASYGAIDIPTTFYPGHDGETIISYQDTYPRNYFQPYNATTNPNGYSEEERTEREFSLLERAVNYINSNYPIPTTLDIDYDHDNYVDNVCFIVRGNTGEWSSLLWPHKWSLYDREVTINGKIVFTFNFQLADATSHFKTSTMCHEMNHSLSAPDLYHYYNGTNLSPVGQWDLMENNATPPQHCGAYMKMKYGHWIDEIPEITQAGTYTLNPISSATPENIAYKISTEDPNQFYVLEYRNKNVETALPGSGLLIYRIDTRFDGNADYNASEGIYDEVYIFRRNGSQTSNGYINQAYFSSNAGRTEFSSSTNPYPFYTGGTIDNNFRIYDITNAGNTISFKYGTLASCEPPTNLLVNVSGQNATLTWEEASNAASYNIYRDGAFIANTTETSYTDIGLPYGVYQYTLKSKDANNALSTSTTPVTIEIQPIPTGLDVTQDHANAILNWTEAEWHMPKSPSETLTHGTQELSDYYMAWNSSILYWGHRHTTESIAAYDGMKLYSVGFHANNVGTYELCVYTGSSVSNDYTIPTQQVYNQSIIITTTGWNSIDLDTPYVIDGEQDLWVFMHNPETISELRSTVCFASGNEGCYYSTEPLSYTYNNLTDFAFLIKAYLTDGTYTYNLYDGTNPVASNIEGTSYTVSNVAENTSHQYTVKTNYYNGESEASNMAGLTLGTASLPSLELATNDKMTITEGSKLTINGTLINANPDHLVLENGAQLIHSSNNVQATLKKDIVSYETEGGWYFIASPVRENIIPDAENGLLTNSYDLYLFDQSEDMEWRNFKASAFSALEHKTGYLYANTGNPTLTFAGSLAASAIPTLLAYDNNADFPGFNLIGNPYPCNTTLERDFYIISDNAVILAENGRQIAPCEGVFVKASETGESVTFNKAAAAKGSNSTGFFDLVVTQVNKDSVSTLQQAQCTTTVDRARVRLGEGTSMEKFRLDDSHSQISLWQNGRDFAVAYANGEKELPLNFKAKKNGTYTLAIEAPSLDLDYLHLIDNLTGADVDLLETPSYTFVAKTTDYVSRFRLVFAPICEDADGDSEAFAYVNNGRIVINADTCNASLQIVDIMGHVVMDGDAKHCVTTSEMTAGVYILRLISAQGVKTQKMVIE